MLQRTISQTLLLVISLSGASYAQPLAEYLPTSPVIYIGWSGSQDLGPGYDQSHLKAMIELSQIDKMIVDVLPQVVARFQEEVPDEDGKKALEFFSTVGVAFWEHPTAFYFGGIDFAGPIPSPQIALICDAGKDAEALHDKFSQLLAEEDEPPFPVVLKRIGRRVVLAIGNLTANQQGALGLVQTFAPVPRLADDKAFQTAVAQTVKDPVVVAYVDGERLFTLIDKGVEMARQQAGPGGGLPPAAMNWPQTKQALGLDGFKRAIVGAGIDGRHWGARCFIEAPAPRRGLLALIDQEPISDELLAAIPASSSMAGAFGFDIAGLIETSKEIVAEFQPEAVAMFEGAIQQSKQAFGFDLIEDLLKPLGSEWAFYIDENTGSSGAFGIVAVNRLRDAKRFAQTLEKVEAAANAMIAAQMAEEDVTIRIKSAVDDGTELHYFGSPLVSPCWAIRDGNLYLGLQPQFVASAAHHVASGGPSIAENPKFAAARKQVGAPHVGSFSFVDLQKTAPDSYSMMTAVSRFFVGLADVAGVEDTPTMVLPPMYKLKPHLKPAASFAWADEKGYYIRSLEPFPGSGAFSVGTTGGWSSLYAMMLPAFFMGVSSAAMPEAVAEPAFEEPTFEDSATEEPGAADPASE